MDTISVVCLVSVMLNSVFKKLKYSASVLNEISELHVQLNLSQLMYLK